MVMNSVGNSFLVQHFTDTVWMLRAEKLKIMTEVILNKVAEDGSLALLQAEPPKGEKIDVVQRRGDIAILNIEGVLVPKASWLDTQCGFTSTLGLHHEFNGLVQDSSVNRIVLYFDTPGGSMIGIEEFANSVFEARSKKEIVAFTDVEMCSAGYIIGAAAEHRIATPSACIGSIGVYTSIIKEKADKSDFDVHIVQAGENKLFGSPVIPMTEKELAYFQDRVDIAYEGMTKQISTFLEVSQDEVKGTEGSFYDASNAPEWMISELGSVDSIF